MIGSDFVVDPYHWLPIHHLPLRSKMRRWHELPKRVRCPEEISTHDLMHPAKLAYCLRLLSDGVGFC